MSCFFDSEEYTSPRATLRSPPKQHVDNCGAIGGYRVRESCLVSNLRTPVQFDNRIEKTEFVEIDDDLITGF